MDKMPTWSGANGAKLALSRLYLTLLQNMIVYTILRNLNSMVDRLSQESLAFVCDKGMFQYVVDIYMHDRTIFKNLFLTLGGFH
jgi:hypothetical protein